MGKLRPPSGKAKSSPEVHPLAAALVAMRPFLCRYLRHLGVSATQGDEVADEVIAAVWTAIAAGRYSPTPGAAPFERWITGFARNAASHWREKRRDALTLNGDPPDEVDPRDVGAAIEARFELAALRLSRLSEEEQVVLFAWLEDADEGMPAIAGRLGLSASTCYKRLYRLRAKLQRR